MSLRQLDSDQRDVDARSVARQYGCPLVTLDAEIRQRTAAIITVQPPTEALATLPSP